MVARVTTPTERAELAAREEGLYEGLRPPALSRYGETRNKTEELI